MAPLRTIVLFYNCNNVNALNVHHPKKTALKLPALGNGTVWKQHKGPVWILLLQRLNSSKTTFEPVDLGEHHAAFCIQFVLMMSTVTWPALNVVIIILKKSSRLYHSLIKETKVLCFVNISVLPYETPLCHY